ncbi:hypothetical protein VPHK469_0101 [Vibrio phage K469]
MVVNTVLALMLATIAFVGIVGVLVLWWKLADYMFGVKPKNNPKRKKSKARECDLWGKM